MSKNRSELDGSKNDDWATPQYVYDYLEENYFKDYSGYFDPCPLHSEFNGLNINWEQANYINPPYSKRLKEAFIKKALQESEKGKLCIMLIPASTETNIFHNVIVPNARVILIKRRIKFKGYNTMREYVTNKTGQSGSMFVIFGKDYKPEITTIELKE